MKIDTEMGARESEAMALLSEINNLIHDLPAPESEGLNWGHVGELGHVIEKLKEIRDFLNS